MKKIEERRFFGMAELCCETRKKGSEPQKLEFISITRAKWEAMKSIAANKLFNATAEIKETIKKKKKKSQAEIDREIVSDFYSHQTPDKFGEIWKRFHYGVHNYAYKFIGDWERAADVVSDTFQKAWEKRHTYNPAKSVYSTWLYTIARNLALTLLQNNARDRLIDVDINDVFHSTMNPVSENIAQNENTYYITNSDGEIESSSFEGVTQKIFNASMEEINHMDPQFVTIIKMKNFKNMTLREIALNLGMTESKVKNIYYKNKEVLRQKLLDEHADLYDTYVDAKREIAESDLIYA